MIFVGTCFEALVGSQTAVVVVGGVIFVFVVCEMYGFDVFVCSNAVSSLVSPDFHIDLRVQFTVATARIRKHYRLALVRHGLLQMEPDLYEALRPCFGAYCRALRELMSTVGEIELCGHDG